MIKILSNQHNNTLPEKNTWEWNVFPSISAEVDEIIDNKTLFFIRFYLKKFIQEEKLRDPSFDRKSSDVFKDINLYRDFESFCLKEFSAWKNELEFKINTDFIKKIREKYSYNISNDIYLYEAIRKHCSYDKKNFEHRSRMLRFNAVYHILESLYLSKSYEKDFWDYKNKFENILKNVFVKLNSWEKYCLEEVLSFLLIPAFKDFPEFDMKIIEKFFWEDIALLIEQSDEDLDNEYKTTYENINIDKNFVVNNENDFLKLLKFFIENEKFRWIDYGFETWDISENLAMFRSFENFCLNLAISWKLKANDYFIDKVNNLKKSFPVRNTTSYQNEVIKKMKFNRKNERSMRELASFESAYHLIKSINSWIKRKAVDEKWNRERSFEHSKKTMEIILKEFPKTNLNMLKIALLHDLPEDFPDISFEMIDFLFWKEVTSWVKELTKVDWRNFINYEEKEEVKILEKWKNKRECKKMFNEDKRYHELVSKAKSERNHIYFWNLKNLSEISWKKEEKIKSDKDILYVKFADRIHNLRTLKWTPIREITRKIIQTEDYFLDVAFKEKQENNHPAYDLMVKEIDKLLEDKEIKKLYEEEKCKWF